METFVIGLGVGVMFGMVGVGGSAFATPLLRLFVGLPGVLAVATPLAATIPSALAGAAGYLRRGIWDRRVAVLSIVAGVPAVVGGSFASEYVTGRALLVVSGFFLLIVGARFLIQRSEPVAREHPTSAPVLAGSIIVGFVSGLLGNGGGFLLIPMYVLYLGLDMRIAAATSLVVVAAFSVPGLIVHAALGHIAWGVALRFGAGSIPGSIIGARIGLRARSASLRSIFGLLLVCFAMFFIVHELIA